MRRRLVLLALLFVSLLGCANLGKKVPYAALGASDTRIGGEPFSNTYPTMVADGLGKKVVNLGSSQSPHYSDPICQAVFLYILFQHLHHATP